MFPKLSFLLGGRIMFCIPRKVAVVKGADSGWVWRHLRAGWLRRAFLESPGRSSALELDSDPPLRHPTTYDDCFALFSRTQNLYNILRASSPCSITFIARPSHLASSPSLVLDCPNFPPCPALRYPSTSKHFRVHV